MARATEIELLAATTLSANGQSVAKKIPTLTMVAIGVDVTASSGTSEALTLFLQCSDDGGTTWYDFPADLRLKTSTAAADPTVDTNKRNIADEDTASVFRVLSLYKHLPAETIRLAWILAGTTPTFDLSVGLIGK